MGPSVYVAFKSSFRCAECSGFIIVEGPTEAITCPDCGHAYQQLTTMWETLLGRPFEDNDAPSPEFRHGSLTTGELGYAEVLQAWATSPPCCGHCGVALPIIDGDVDVDVDVDVVCAACGQGTPSFPAPAWLQTITPRALQVVGAPRPDHKGVAVVADDKPVCFVCPRCGAALDVNRQAPRILACSYCSADLYIPDALWRRLHPVKKRTTWWVRFATT